MNAVSLKSRISDDSKTALKTADKPRLSALRLILSEIKQREVDTREELSDDAIQTILEKMAKQRRDSLKQYLAANREDLAVTEQFELDVIAEYQPEALSKAEVDALIAAALKETGASSMKDMGKVMAALKPRIQGRADMGQVSNSIKSRLTG